MTAEYTRADALRTYLTGALGEGGVQNDPTISFGGYRSSMECKGLGVAVRNPIRQVIIQFAGPTNGVGTGLLASVDDNGLIWKGPKATSYGPPTYWSTTEETRIVESSDAPGSYLRIRAKAPFFPGEQTVELFPIYGSSLPVQDVTISEASSGVSHYAAVMVKNVSSFRILNARKWVSLLGTPQVSDVGYLSGTGAGTITTTGSFKTWPRNGWCQVRDSGGTLKEIIYYSSRTNTVLTVPANGRSKFATSNTAGANTDVLSPVSGTLFGMDPTGVIAAGAGIQTIANKTTAPGSVTWEKGLSYATGLTIGTLKPGEQVGIWLWSQIPQGAVATPLHSILGTGSFEIG